MKPEDDPLSYRDQCSRFLLYHGNRPAAALLDAIPRDVKMDRYGDGGVVAELEAEVGKLLGKPAVAFFPSGTMAQQAAMRVHADRSGCDAIGFHGTSHLEIHEDKAYQRLHGLVGVTLGSPRRLITLADLKAVPEDLAAVLIELPQREIGGQLPSWEALTEQVAYIRERGWAVHLDGARLWESQPFYGRPHAEIAGLFDTVYVSFYKGLGGLAGACLAGEPDVIKEARAWRKRMGGTLFGMWPNATTALAGLRERLPRMPVYADHARAIAKALHGVPGVEVVPAEPQTPMFHLHVRASEDGLRAAMVRLAKERGLFTWGGSVPGYTPSTRLLEFTVGEATLGFAPEEVAAIVKELVP